MAVVAAAVVVVTAATAAVAVVVAVAAVAAVDATSVDALAPLAVSIGEAWTRELVRTLRDSDREIVGAWPGTMREARMRVMTRVRTRLDTIVLDDLARVANLAARRCWLEISEPDLEP